ncbi:hypothetical protein P3S68_024868 [Capsicum galapagoense]
MGGKSSSSMLGFVLAFLLYVSVFQLLMANEEAKPSELNVLQLPISNSEALDEVFQVVTTRYGHSNRNGQGKVSFCLRVRFCNTDADCVGASCGHRCSPTYGMHDTCGP